MASKDPAPSDRGKPARRPPSLLVWWLTLGALVVWNLLVFWPRPRPEVRVPYTRFVAAVRADDVARVQIVGDEITGWLVKPLAWPEKIERGEAKAVEGAQTYTKIVTTLPAVVGDPRLLELLEAHQVEVTAEHPSAPWLMELLTGWGPLLLLVGFFWWTGRKAVGQQAGLFGLGRTRARRYVPEGPQVTFDDVAGADEAKAELQEEVDFLRHPQKYHDLGARIPRGVLLVGPPGTGKTLLARAVAGEAGVPFFSLSGSEFVEMFVGVGASRVRDLFAQAKAAAPAIVFVDELDAVGRRRGTGFGTVNDEREQTLNQLLVEMDGFDDRHEVIMLAATNRPDVLDPALLRPGRFDRKVEVGLPDRKGREGILRIHTRRLRLGADVALDQLARATTGLSGADLANLCNEAALLAAHAGRGEVTMADFGEAEDKALLGGRRRLVLPPAERRVIAYHESGHALVAWLTPAADPVHKVTIVPHGRALGVTEQQPGEDRYNYSLSYLMARLAVMLGGRTAEEIVLGDVTTGAENDLVEATRLARHMVTRWGMGALGLAAFGQDGQPPVLGYDVGQGRDYSEATAARIDEEVRRLLDERHEAARRLLAGARPALDRLVEALLHEETVALPELERLLGPRPAVAPTPAAPPGSP
ncbi:MAG TPA: ATP-dependent zinc metalloprotease FtsH [Candidatus Binatia bacterium]|nr:ATP-dependent zinc metalloprotease FtsH [Candidatus Binatia bacterium]